MARNQGIEWALDERRTGASNESTSRVGTTHNLWALVENLILFVIPKTEWAKLLT